MCCLHSVAERGSEFPFKPSCDEIPFWAGWYFLGFPNRPLWVGLNVCHAREAEHSSCVWLPCLAGLGGGSLLAASLCEGGKPYGNGCSQSEHLPRSLRSPQRRAEIKPPCAAGGN